MAAMAIHQNQWPASHIRRHVISTLECRPVNLTPLKNLKPTVGFRLTEYEVGPGAFKAFVLDAKPVLMSATLGFELEYTKRGKEEE